MKILHIGKYFSPFSGGLENYMRDAMVALARRGIRSVALVHRHSLSLKTTDETFVASGFEFAVTRTGMWARLLYTPISPAFVWQLRRVIKTTKPDILHLHLPNPSVFWGLFMPSARRIPWVVHWHADVITASQGPLMRFFYKLYRPFEKAVLRRARSIIATSPPYRDSSQPLQAWLDKCQVVPLGMDRKKFIDTTVTEHDRDGALLKPASPVLKVLAIGRLTYYKGFEHLLRAIAQAPGIEAHLVGDGDQAAFLTSLASSLGIRDRVTFHGSLGDAELARQYQACDCVCLPSIERTEAFGMVLLEAMYFGKATIVADVPGSGMGWVVDHGVTGIKVPPADHRALADALARLTENNDELLRMGRQGKVKFDSQFDIDHAVEGLLDIYRAATHNAS